MVTVQYAQDGRILSYFEVGMQVGPTQTSAISEEIDHRLKTSGKPKIQVALEAASDWVGAPFVWETTFGGDSSMDR